MLGLLPGSRGLGLREKNRRRSVKSASPHTWPPHGGITEQAVNGCFLNKKIVDGVILSKGSLVTRVRI